MANPEWVQVALAEQGQTEIVGARNNARIVEYHATTTLRAREDETPWCASFVGWCLQQAGLTGTRSAAASSYECWGQALPQPVIGAIVTFTRASGGHVGFYMGQRDGKWLILGGNQSNRVRIAAYDSTKHTGIRWPFGVPLPNGVAPLSKSGVIWGSLAAGAMSVAQVGNGLVASADSVNVTRAWISDGGLVSVLLGLLALGGVIFAIYARAKGKAAEATAQ
jgi:uncharacterized protein (TIGR02594 family)